jgi:gluconolactonase
MTIKSCMAWIALACGLVLADEPIEGVGPVGEARKVAGGFQFTEGPAWDGAGNLYFTDIPSNRIHVLRPDGEVEVFLEPSGHCNGLMVDGAGQLLACEMDGRLLRIDPATKQVTVLAQSYQGNRFNAPNDLVVDRAGGVYFTDPRYRAPDPWPQGVEAVYYRDASGGIRRVAEGIVAPNGVILSPDEKVFYVIPSMEANIYAFEVRSPGVLGERRVLATMRQPEGRRDSGGDGLTIDTEGRLYVTTQLGLQVFAADGQLLGIIEIPEHPANVTFGGEGLSTLYVTARNGLYAVPTRAKGHVFPGAVE